MKAHWYWRVSCYDNACRYSSNWYGHRWIARLIARLHVLRCHPWGRVTIAAADASVIQTDMRTGGRL